MIILVIIIFHPYNLVCYTTSLNKVNFQKILSTIILISRMSWNGLPLKMKWISFKQASFYAHWLLVKKDKCKLTLNYCYFQAQFTQSQKCSGGDSSLNKRQQQVMGKGLPQKKNLPGVKNIVLIASGKGGVGKSTTAGVHSSFNVICLFSVI